MGDHPEPVREFTALHDSRRTQPPGYPSGEPHAGRAMRPALLFCLSVLLSLPVCADSVDVAVAANFAGPMAAIAERFHAATGHDVRLSPGATGKLYAQVANGAPFDVFLSADDGYVNRLVASGHADARTSAAYASGRLALWSRSDRGLILSAGLTSLTDARVFRKNFS